jgi:hypothetical protein
MDVQATEACSMCTQMKLLDNPTVNMCVQVDAAAAENTQACVDEGSCPRGCSVEAEASTACGYEDIGAAYTTS